MKILFLSHRIPYPPNKGDKLRAFNIIKHLSDKNQIDLLSFLDYDYEKNYAEKLKDFCASVETVSKSPIQSTLQTGFYLTRKLPLTLGHFYSKKFKKIVKNKLLNNKYDLIFVFSSAMAQYVADYKECFKILDLVDADSEKWLQYAKYAPFWKSLVYQLEGNRLREYEKKISRYFDICTVVTKQEKDILEDIINNNKLRVVKNGFDLEKVEGVSNKKTDEPALLFIGGMFYFAYIDGVLQFYKNVLPMIKKEIPQVRFYIVGADPAPSIKKLSKDSQIRVTGHVPDVKPYLQKAWVYVVPLRVAPGIQNKILEAMAVELPVVATTPAISGIEAQNKKNVLVADTHEEFANAVINLIKDDSLRKVIGENGRKLVEEKYNWNKNLQDLDQIIYGMCGPQGRGNKLT